ncbi:MAG: alpha-galactosidase [Ilumatobacteraceae bacterium]|nr:alpha-galactosidase [Ilumatobacteraceae bacterium]
MIHLRGRLADVLIDESSGSPVIVHWGAPLGAVDLDSVIAAFQRPVTNGALDAVAPVSIVPEHGSGYPGRPGLLGARAGGRDWAPRFAPFAVQRSSDTAVRFDAVDEVAGLRMATSVELGDVLTARVEATNVGSTPYALDNLLVTLPLPSHAVELLRFTGRWSREFQPVRQPLASGTFVIENRTGRSSQDHVPVVFAGTKGFGEWAGEVWGAHIAWSSNFQIVVQVLPDGRRVLALGELLHPGEVVLEPGESYATPETYATYAPSGLTAASWGFHRLLRSRPSHPTSPRPVLINTWEAVYFDHDFDRLTALATAAAEVGVERYVLDDGWFGSRRNDRSGLGDWVVSPEAHPNGLAPLIAHVRSLGMEFGIWVEPEMVNPDSDLYRAHPEWALVDTDYEPVLARNQLVLDLAIPEAYAHVRDHLHALLRDHDVAFVKWDMNRNHVQASGADGAAGTHAQTLALYRLLDELAALHPTVEIESCASGGGRVDFEILRRTQRVWASDCIDALERQTIQRGLSMFLPPELIGAHIGAPTSHTTGRTHSLGFRTITALFGHMGVEWNLLDIDAPTRAELAAAIDLHKRFRSLLHTGDTVRFDPVNDGEAPTSLSHGVYASDRSEALVAVVQLRTDISLTPPMLRLPGLDPDSAYRVESLDLPRQSRTMGRRQPDWVAAGITVSGRQLAAHGLQLPSMNPESAVLLHLTTQKAVT